MSCAYDDGWESLWNEFWSVFNYKSMYMYIIILCYVSAEIYLLYILYILII